VYYLRVFSAARPADPGLPPRRLAQRLLGRAELTVCMFVGGRESRVRRQSAYYPSAGEKTKRKVRGLGGAVKNDFRSARAAGPIAETA
jgi:hypothetical protein